METSHPTVAVVGVGTVGSMALWQLARRGIRAVGFDAYAPGHDRGGYGGQSRIFRLAYEEGVEYVPLLQRSMDLWGELQTESGQHLFHPTGGLTFAPPGSPALAMLRRCVQAFDLPHEELSPAESMARHPQLPVDPGEEVFFDPATGVLAPERAVIAAAERAEELGATIHRYTPVLEIVPSADGVTVRTEGGEQRFDRVVLCPGPWATEIDVLRRLALEVHQITTLWYGERAPGTFAPDRTPIVLRRGPIGYSQFPSVDGESVKISLHSAARPRVPSAEHVSRNPPEGLVGAMRTAVVRHLPGLHPDPVRVGCYSDAFTADGHGLVGELADLPGVTVVTGLSAHGFKLAPVLGEVAADLAVNGRTSHRISHLDPARSGV